MIATTKPLFALNAADLMSQEVITIPQDLSLRTAADRLFRNAISGAPVVDAGGHCIGMLCASDFMQWARDGGAGADEEPLPPCPYQLRTRLAGDADTVTCTLAEGSCTYQELRPASGGRHIAVCTLPPGTVAEGWPRLARNLPASPVCRYMTADVVTVAPETPVAELARMMIDAHIHRLAVVDEERRPVGVVTSTDILAAVAYASGAD